MRIVSPGQFLQGIQLEMTREQLAQWLERIHLPVEIMTDGEKVKRHFYIINGQPVTVYEVPREEKKDA